MNGLPEHRLRRLGRAWVATNAVVTARVRLGEDANVWYGAVLRGDDARIEVGDRTNVQDQAVVHVDPGRENLVGSDVTIGHGAICHGVRIEDFALVGMGAVLLGGSVVGEGAVVGAGALVPEEMHVPPFSVVVGVPARIVKQLDPDERRREARAHARGYVDRAREHAEGRWLGLVDS